MIIVRYMYILDEDAEDTEDTDDDRSSFHSPLGTMFGEVRKSHYSEAKTPKARDMTSLVELVLLTVEPISTEI